jgi:hypothetical protein
MAMPRLARAWGALAVGGAGAALLSPAAVAHADKAADKKPAGPLFDPEALERGAKALREINASPHAKQARPAAGPAFRLVPDGGGRAKADLADKQPNAPRCITQSAPESRIQFKPPPRRRTPPPRARGAWGAPHPTPPPTSKAHPITPSQTPHPPAATLPGHRAQPGAGGD